MKSRKVKIAITSAVLAVLLAVISVGYTFAWFADYQSIDILLYTDDDGAYFAGGSGTEGDPYVIANYKHLYNLAWLQNDGKFDDTTTTTYFKLSDDIGEDGLDMAEGGTYCVIPPIGNDEHPFTGVFNGNGKTIKNLVVSTDKNKLSNTDVAAVSSYKFSNYVGLFGKTGEKSNIYNFILDNPIVEVANDNTLYSDTTTSSACVGLAIGYVANAASSIGVIGGYLSVQKSGYTTYNSILGDIDENVEVSVTGGSVGSDWGYYVPDLMYEKLSTYFSENNSLSFVYNFESTSTKQNLITFNDGLIVSDKGTNGTNNSANYFGLGNFALATTTNVRIRSQNNESTNTEEGATKKIESIYSAGTYNWSSGTAETFTCNYSGDSQNISAAKKLSAIVAETADSGDEDGVNYGKTTDFKSFLEKIDSDDSTDTDNYYTSFNCYYRTNSNGASNTTKTSLVYSENYTDGTDKNGVLESSSSTYNLPQEAVLFNAVTNNSRLFIVFGSYSSSDPSIYVDLISTTSINSFRDDYSRFSNNSENTITTSIGTNRLEIKNIGTDAQTKDIATAILVELPKAGIYAVYAGGSNVAFYYLVVDGVAGDKYTADTTQGVSAIDFIYSGVTIVDGDFVLTEDNSTAYTPTGTMIYLSTSASTTTTAVLVIAYIRSSDYEGYYDSAKTHTIHISYSGTDTPTGSDDSVVDKDNSLSGFTVPSTGDEKNDTG